MSGKNMSHLSKSFPPRILLAMGWYSSAIHRGIARYAKQAGWSLDIKMTRSGVPPQTWEGHGIISTLGVSDKLDQFAKSTQIPVVNIGYSSDFPDVPRIASDNQFVGKLAADYFFQRGFKNYAFFLKKKSLGELERLGSFREQCLKNQWKFHLIDWHHESLGCSEENMDVKFSSWILKELKKIPKPVAIFSEIDDYAIEILDSCIHAKIPVPDQIAILGVGNDSLRCDFAAVPLSSIDDDQEMIGFQAASVLDQSIQKKCEPIRVTLIPPKEVITRQSTDILSIDHPLVASVLKTIWNHYRERIGAKEVAATVPMSYRRLHDAFIQHIGHSIADEITRKRLEYAKHLLIETSKKTHEIAILSGFPNQDRMGKVFRRKLNMTPDTFRKRFLIQRGT